MRFVVLLLAASCGNITEVDTDTSGTARNTTACGSLSVVRPDSKLLYIYPNDDSYGVNSFAIWEVSSYGEVEQALPYKDWQMPDSLWGAIRFNLDGLDPYQFTDFDPFIYRYLPSVHSTISWQSTTDARNDGTCPNNNTVINGWNRCIGEAQLDISSPVLQSGTEYLIRMGMIVPLGEDDNYKKNRVQSCYQATLIF